MTGRVAIVGAGIVGAAIARALARDGSKVVVLDDRPIGSGATAAGMIEQARGLGAEVRLDAAVGAIGGGWVRLGNGARVEADYVVNAAGAGAPRLTPGLAIRPRKGHLVITDRHPGFVTHQILELGYLKSAHGNDPASVAFNVQPRATGQLLIGSSRQFDVEDPAVEPAMVRKMIDRALLYMPALAGLSAIRAW